MATLRDVSLILLAVSVFVMGLVPLTLLGGLAYGVWWLRRHDNVPTWLRLARGYVGLGQAYVERAMRAAAGPFLRARSSLAQVQGMLRAISRQGGDR